MNLSVSPLKKEKKNRDKNPCVKCQIKAAQLATFIHDRTAFSAYFFSSLKFEVREFSRCGKSPFISLSWVTAATETKTEDPKQLLMEILTYRLFWRAFPVVFIIWCYLVNENEAEKATEKVQEVVVWMLCNTKKKRKNGSSSTYSWIHHFLLFWNLCMCKFLFKWMRWSTKPAFLICSIRKAGLVELRDVPPAIIPAVIISSDQCISSQTLNAHESCRHLCMMQHLSISVFQEIHWVLSRLWNLSCRPLI